MKKEDQCRHYRHELARSQRRMADLETRGVEAMSRYDIEIAHGGRAEEALHTALWLVSNHLRYFSEKLSHCDEPVQQITLFDASPTTDPLSS